MIDGSKMRYFRDEGVGKIDLDDIFVIWHVI